MMDRARWSFVIAAVVAVAGLGVRAAPKETTPPLTEESVLKGIKGPEKFDVSVFAMPPNVMYPTAVAATPDGVVYVAIDEDGSLGKEPGRGRVVKCVDTDGDG